MRPQVILLPGGVMPAELAYGALIEALGDEVEAVAKDLEVYAGLQPPADYTLDYEIDGVLRSARDAAFDRFHLVGYSGGGASSLAFAARCPERLLSLSLIEPAWLGNEGLSPEERAVREEFERIAALGPEEMMPAFVAIQLAPGVAPPPPPPGPPPPWMAARPAGLRAFLTAFDSSTLDLARLRAFERPVYFAIGALSNPDYYGRMAERARQIFSDFTLEVFTERHHFDPPHRTEPERTARALRAHWARADGRALAPRPG
ncbi:MAG TPA: alpha/beta hydrolase [Solirubrobacteraceae bacterium]|nr:alpha/beta hydrolase [Solirubrobacteraceae bacterium]